MDEPLHHRLLRSTVRLEQQLDVVRPNEGAAESVHGADERHHELVRRMVVELARRRGLLDPAGVHDHDAVRDLHRLFLVVRDNDGRRVRLVV